MIRNIASSIINESKVFIIAEAGVNHNGDVNIAKKMIDAAVNANADAVKIQSYITDELIIPQARMAPYQKLNTKNITQSQMLKKLEGETHIVTTACSLKYREKEIVFSEDTKVHFKHLNDDLLSYYIQNYQALDKAGSYGIQDWIGLIGVEKIIGSYTNVVGLPTARLFEKIIEITE